MDMKRNRGGYNHSDNPSRHHSYRLHERLGPETREKEYKAAQGGFMYNELRDTISKYACGFLNSQVEGKLMLGVNDDGEVIGISNGNADKERRTIDAAMKDLQPPVFPQDYRLEYCDIYDEQNNKITEWSVVELTVFAKNNLTSLYQTNRRECYMRRDASTERMWPQQIQEWLRQKLTTALQKKENDCSNLQSKCERLEEETKSLQAELKELKETNTQQAEKLTTDLHQKEKDCSNLQIKCERQEHEVKNLQTELKELKEKTTQQAEEAGSSVHRELQDIKNILEKEKQAKEKQAKTKQSRVCTIS